MSKIRVSSCLQRPFPNLFTHRFLYSLPRKIPPFPLSLRTFYLPWTANKFTQTLSPLFDLIHPIPSKHSGLMKINCIWPEAREIVLQQLDHSIFGKSVMECPFTSKDSITFLRDKYIEFHCSLCDYLSLMCFRKSIYQNSRMKYLWIWKYASF